MIRLNFSRLRLCWLCLLCTVLSCKSPTKDDEDDELRSARIAAAKAAKKRASQIQLDSSDPTPLVSYRFHRDVSLFYKVDLHNNNRLSSTVAAVLRSNEDAMRACYTERLTNIPSLAGDLQLKFALIKSSGIATQIMRVGGTLTDQTMIGCVIKRFSEIRFQIPYDLRGLVHYRFSVTEHGESPRSTIGFSPTPGGLPSFDKATIQKSQN